MFHKHLLFHLWSNHSVHMNTCIEIIIVRMLHFTMNWFFIFSVLWHPTGDTTTLVGLTDSHIITWDFDASSSVAKVCFVLNALQNLKNCFHQMTLRKKLSLFNVFVKDMRTGNRHTDGFFYFKVKDSTGLESKGQPKFTCVRWNPHHNCTQVATANDSCIRGWDLRSMQWVFMFKARITLLSLNFNRGFDTYTCDFLKLILNLIHVFLQRKGIPFICFS